MAAESSATLAFTLVRRSDLPCAWILRRVSVSFFIRRGSLRVRRTSSDFMRICAVCDAGRAINNSSASDAECRGGCAHRAVMACTSSIRRRADFVDDHRGAEPKCMDRAQQSCIHRVESSGGSTDVRRTRGEGECTADTRTRTRTCDRSARAIRSNARDIARPTRRIHESCGGTSIAWSTRRLTCADGQDDFVDKGRIERALASSSCA